MSKFYMIDPTTGKRSGPVIMDPFDNITDEEYDQIAEDANNERIHSLIEASAEINELRGDCKKMLDVLFKTTAALSIALRDYNGPYTKNLKEREEQASEMCAYMQIYYE